MVILTEWNAKVFKLKKQRFPLAKRIIKNTKTSVNG
jgi:hypothetical protein